MDLINYAAESLTTTEDGVSNICKHETTGYF